MASKRERWFVRVSTLAIAVAAAIAAALMATPAKLPPVALGSEFLLDFERGLALLAGFLFVFVVVARGWKGELPIAVSQRGAEWAEAAGETTGELEAQVTELRQRLKRVEVDLEDVSKIVLEMKR